MTDELDNSLTDQFESFTAAAGELFLSVLPLPPEALARVGIVNRRFHPER